MQTAKTSNLLKILICLLCLCVMASTAMSALSFKKTSELDTRLSKHLPEDQGETRENDVTIAGSYKIRDTSKISDAYKSKNTQGLDDREKETLEMASAILDKIITDGMSDFEKEIAVYKWLTTELKGDTGSLTVIPSSGADADNPYGVLKNRNAVCVGYATTFRLFMQMLDIECMVVHDRVCVHSWDLVKLDGDWYHIDCYMDAGNGNFRSFNMNDYICKTRGHEWDTDFFPAAGSVKYNYAVRSRVELGSIFDIPAWAMKAAESGDLVAAASFREKITPEMEPVAAVMMNLVCQRLNGISDLGDIYAEHSWITDDNGDYIVCLNINKFSEEPDMPELDEDTMEKIEKAINDAFGEQEDFDPDGGEEPIDPIDLDEMIADLESSGFFGVLERLRGGQGTEADARALMEGLSGLFGGFFGGVEQ